MNDFLLMDIPDTRDELGKEFCSIFLLEVAVGQDVVEKLATRGVLENYANVLVCFDDIVQPDDVRMLQGLRASQCQVHRRRSVLTRRTSISRSTFDIRTELSMLPRRINFTATSSPH